MFDHCRDVRFGEVEDTEQIFRLMTLAHGEAGEHSMNEEKVRARIHYAVSKQGSVIGVIGERGDKLRGYVLLLVDPIWYSSEYQLLELSNFVHPDHRRSDYAKQLIRFSRACAEDLGIDLMMGIISNNRTEAKIRLYRRQIPYAGAFFTYHPNGAARHGQ